MDYGYTFSIILSINNFTTFSFKTLDSIINNQSFNFKENVQLVILTSDDNVHINLSDYLDKFPENIIIVTNLESEFDYGCISDYVVGEYVLFLKNNLILSNGALTEVNNIFENNNSDVVFLLNKEFMDKEYYKDGTILLDLNEKNNLIPLNDSIYFINAKIFKDITKLYDTNDLWTIVIKSMDVKNIYAITSKSYYLIQYLESKKDKVLNSNLFHINKIKNFYLNLLDYSITKYGRIPQFIQEVFIYELSNLIEEFDIDSLNDDNKTFFSMKMNEIISKLDFNNILNYSFVDSRRKNFLLYLYNNQKILLENNDNKLDLMIRNHLVDNLNRHKIWLDLVDINDGVLNISGLLQSYFPNENISINLISQRNNKKKIFGSKLIDYTQDERKNISYLSTNWVYRYNFDFEILIEDIIGSMLFFEVNYDNNDIIFSYKPEVAFRIPASLSTSSIYQTTDEFILYFKDNSFKIQKNKYSLLLKLELSNLKKIFRDRSKGYLTAILLRIMYVLAYPFIKKRDIWLFNDRLSIADDNAICLYDYAIKKDDGINNYFIISGQSEDYTYLKKKYPNIVKFGSLKHKLLYLFADKLVYSFVNEDYSNPFHIRDNLEYKKLYSGLFSFKRYFLQHGVSLGDYSNSIKKYNMNLSLIDTSSIIEAESYKTSSYGFKEEIIQILGLPRYDKLDKSLTKKQIIFMPTWRSYLNHDESLFKYSKFYKTVSDLLNNQKLHKLLEENGYEFVFKPHPELYKYLDYFSLENVILSDESYQKLFNESSILITDYSSVAFDFAYLKKPVIYYQNSDDYHYKEGYFNFETMGFGEVVSNENELINKIEEYIVTESVMEDKYQDRVNKFFSYHDKENCKRVYSWIKNN